MENELQVVETKPRTALQIKAQVQAIQEVMNTVMKDGHHYGKIPGCGDKPTLLKPGAEKIMMTFRLAADPRVEEIPTDDGMTFRVFTRITDQASGTFLGTGVGECSTKEDKYNWRGIVSEDEWNATPEDRRRIKFTRDRQIKQIRTNAADIANTVLKMAKKRSLVDATLTVTAASDIFTQDLEETPDELKETVTETKSGTSKPPLQEPGEKKKAPPAQKTEGAEGGLQAVGILDDVIIKTGKNKKNQPWTKHALRIEGVYYNTFDTDLGAEAVALKGQKVTVTYEHDGQFLNCKSVAPAETLPDPEDCTKDPKSCDHSTYGELPTDVTCNAAKDKPCIWVQMPF